MLKRVIWLIAIFGSRAEVAAGAAIVAIALMLVLPLPLWLLDTLIAVNLAAASLLAILALFVPSPVAFSTFPAILLLTTLFRLGLEVAATRQILLEADAGHIVETFGEFAVGGNIAVGLIVFLILAVVQFLVITKGSERVAEVAARFTLDGMPGKQMAIDMDLRGGHITGEQAREKRANVVRESQLFGAMDGAMKFVKGDAIAGLVIVVINLVGGLAIGMLQRDMSAAEALNTYAVLSIGEALVAQMPALLISICAGLIITRVTTTEDPTNLGRDIFDQVLAHPTALQLMAGALLAFGLIPGMPFPVFATLAIGAAALGWTLNSAAEMVRTELTKQIEARQKPPPAPKFIDKASFPAPDPLVLEMRCTSELREVLEFSAREARNRAVEGLGMLMPPFVLQHVPTSAETSITVRVNGTPVFSAQLRPDRLGILRGISKLSRSAVPHEVVRTRQQLTPIAWIPPSDKDAAASIGLSALPLNEVVTALTEAALHRYGPTFMTLGETQKFVRWLERNEVDTHAEFLKLLPLPKFTEVLQRLLAEQVPIVNVRGIVSCLIEWAPRERDTLVLAEHVRAHLRREICNKLAVAGRINALVVAADLEDAIRAAVRQTAHGAFLALPPDLGMRLTARINQELDASDPRQSPPVIVTAVDVRRFLRRFLEEEFFSTPVIAFSELVNEIDVVPIGQLSLSEL